ncbi:hypothetical protein ABZ915_19430 [Streptomyces sp. NPDC046915]|uniref:hypothetical protein n=1 Tax=Streptomyces sp. NPDC046915 TaxID=3155257 RepID=UPI0033F27CE9
MSWKRGLLVALVVCVPLLLGPAACGTSDANERKDGESPSPVGRLLDGTDREGRHYREVGKDRAPEVGIEVMPDAGGSWDVRLTVRNFRFSAPGAKAEAVAGRGLACLFVDGGQITRLRTPGYRLAARLVPRGTHHVTARLYADDGTVWAVHGKPVESTADITASGAESSPESAPETSPESAPETSPESSP